jgi:hypothetical protein
MCAVGLHISTVKIPQEVRTFQSFGGITSLYSQFLYSARKVLRSDV